MAEEGQNPTELPVTTPYVETFLGTEGNLKSQHIEVAVNGPSYSTIQTSNVVGIVQGNFGTGIDHRSQMIEFTKQRIREETEGMIHVSMVDLIAEKLKGEHKWITITGNAGDGKTTLGYLVLKSFMDKKIMYVIRTPEDYHHISKMIREDQVIMLNDIFGAFTFDPTKISLWGSMVQDILDSHEKSAEPQTRVVFVSRKNVLQDAKDHLERYGELISEQKVCVDLSRLKEEEERLKILGYHLQKKKVFEDHRLMLRAAAMNTSHGFPHCCKIYAELRAEGREIDLLDFFGSPLKFLDATTRLLLKSGCEDLFIHLIENDGVFNINSISDGKERRTLRDMAAVQAGSYLKKTEDGSWVFNHPSIHESVLSVLAERDPLLVVQHASISVLLQKMRFKSTSNETKTCYICLEQESDVMNALVERFIPEIQKGCYDIFAHELAKNKQFCELLLKKAGPTLCIDQIGVCRDTMLWRATQALNYTAV